MILILHVVVRKDFLYLIRNAVIKTSPTHKWMSFMYAYVKEYKEVSTPIYG